VKGRRFVRIVVPVLFAAAAIATAWAQGSFNKTAFNNSMEDAGRAARFALGGLIVADFAKVSAQATTIVGVAKKVREMPPPTVGAKAAEYQADADTLASRANRLIAAAKAEKAGLASEAFGSMIGACMKCHGSFRRE
jgi:cytochrome c556